MAEPVVSLDDVSVRIGPVTIVRGVDLTLAAGEVVGMFGGNGAGKTTLLRLLATELVPSTGRAQVLGVDVATGDRFDLRRRIGMVGHAPALYPELTLAENLAFAARIAGADPEQTGDVLATVGLAGAADRPAAKCSHGMQRRAELARELLRRPSLLLLDEPHSALDAAASDVVAHLVDRVAGNGGAAVLVSHDRDRVEKLASRTVELVGGRLS